jgi:hypothetical protein
VTNTLPDIDLDLVTEDHRPCEWLDCGHEAVWTPRLEHPCSHEYAACVPCREYADREQQRHIMYGDNSGWQCGTCGSMNGLITRWDRL